MQAYYSHHQQRPSSGHPGTRQAWTLERNQAVMNQFSFNSPAASQNEQPQTLPEPSYATQQPQRQTVSSPLRHHLTQSELGANFNQTGPSMGPSQQQQPPIQQYFSQTQQSQKMPLLSNTAPAFASGLDCTQSMTSDTLNESRLMSKVQAQQDRLKYLDNYRVVCEKRIRELAPSHPLPVLPSHCGQPNPDIEDLKNRLRLSTGAESNTNHQEVLKYRQVIDQLTGEKLQLEETLRHETLANEEQRNYIEILRQTIDQKMEGLGLGDLLAHRNLRQGQDAVSVYSILSELKRECDSWKKDYRALEEKLQLQEDQLRKEHEIEQQLKVKVEEQIAQNERILQELEKLQAQSSEDRQLCLQRDKEKEQLLEYTEDNLKQIEQLGQDLDREKVRAEENEKAAESLRTDNTGLSEQVAKLTAENEELVQTCGRQTELLGQLKDQLRGCKRELEQLRVKSDDQEAKIQDSDLLIEQLRGQLAEKTEVAEQLKASLRSAEEDCMLLSKEKDRVAEERQIIEKRARVEEESLRKRVAMHEDYAAQHEAKLREMEQSHLRELEESKKLSERRIQDITQERQSVKEKCLALERQVNELKKQRETLYEESTMAKHDLSEAQERLEVKAREASDLQGELRTVKEEVSQASNQCGQLEEQLLLEKERREWLSQERDRLVEQLDEAQSKFEAELATNEVLIRKTQLLEQEIEDHRRHMSKELSHKTDESIQLMRQLEMLQSEQRKAQSQVEYLKSAKSDLESRLMDFQQEVDSAVREKRLFEKQVQDLRAENELLFKSEDRVKRLIEECESLRAQLRYKDRDIAVLNDKVLKNSGELESAEREVKRTGKELSEVRFQAESAERLKAEFQCKLKEVEKRVFELGSEKQEAEARIRALQNQMEELRDETESWKREAWNQGQERGDREQQVQKLREKQTDIALEMEAWSSSTEDLELVVKSMSEKAKQYLSSFLTRVQASEQLQDMVPRATREQAYLILQTLDTPVTATGSQSKSVLKALSFKAVELRNFLGLFTEQSEAFISELLMAKQDFRLMETKVGQLETRLGSTMDQMNETAVVSEKARFLATELDTLRAQKNKLAMETRSLQDNEAQFLQRIEQLRAQVDILAQENKFLAEKVEEAEQQREDLGTHMGCQLDELQREASQLKSKEQRIAQLTREKRQMEELVQKVHGYVGSGGSQGGLEQQRLIGELVRTMNERFKWEGQRLKHENEIDSLEQELKELIKSQNDNEEGSLLRAQFLRRQITDIEMKLSECEMKIDGCLRKERTMDSELKLYAEQKLISQFAFQEHTQTLTYLTRESQELRSELVAKTQRVQDLERQLASYQQATSYVKLPQQTMNIFENEQQQQHSSVKYSVPSSSVKQKTAPFVSNTLGATFERHLANQDEDSAFAGGNSRVLHLQPIKVEDYDIKPEKQQPIEMIGARQQVDQENLVYLSNLMPDSTKPSLVSGKHSFARPIDVNTTAGTVYIPGGSSAFSSRVNLTEYLSPSHPQQQHQMALSPLSPNENTHPLTQPSQRSGAATQLPRGGETLSVTQKGQHQHQSILSGLAGFGDCSTPLQARLSQMRQNMATTTRSQVSASGMRPATAGVVARGGGITSGQLKLRGAGAGKETADQL